MLSFFAAGYVFNAVNYELIKKYPRRSEFKPLSFPAGHRYLGVN